MKWCTKCGEEFEHHKYSRCRPCRTAIHREWVDANRERAREINRLSRERHPDADRERDRRKRESTPEYFHWKQMNSRCHNQNNKKFPIYGGRGITVCGEWCGAGGFERFLQHIGPRPRVGFSVDRKDNERGYEPGNVRWATPTDQARNTRQVRKLTTVPEARCLTEAAELHGLTETALRQRLDAGWSETRALSTPVRPKERMITARGVTRSALEWSRLLGGSLSLVSRRIHDGWRDEDAAMAPLGCTQEQWLRRAS